MIRLNGDSISGCEGITVEELVNRQNFNKSRIAVEINGTIIPKKDYETTQIQENDVVEVVSFVGGG
ncbi:MAG: sulfur carrier protein ThiS [Eubacterium sp.]|nr:sulfur carrier protein ThiS [Eubacterium sp.]